MRRAGIESLIVGSLFVGVLGCQPPDAGGDAGAPGAEREDVQSGDSDASERDAEEGADGADGAADAGSSEVELRIKNASDRTYSTVEVNSNGAEETYSSVDPGECSSFKPMPYAYRYAAVDIEADGATYSAIPTDYLGEEKLSSGDYTYVLSLSGNGGEGSVMIELERPPYADDFCP